MNKQGNCQILISVGENGIENYEKAVMACGAVPVVSYKKIASAEDYDGLILCGGVDINPARYGMDNRGSENCDNERDEAEFSILDDFVRSGKPVFGICRGMQLINVYFGGTLIQHLPDADIHRTLPQGEVKMHSVIAGESSIVGRLYGKEFKTNSYHHQAVKKLGNLTILCKCAESRNGSL